MPLFSIGIDMVFIPKLKNLNLDSLVKVFHPYELEDSTPEHLAGIWAAKEAFFKVLGKKCDWLDVSIEKEKNGRPFLYSTLLKKNQEVSISITHEQDYAIAVVLLL